MKKTFSLLIAMLMSISLSAFAGTTTKHSIETSPKSKTEKVSVPANLILKQTITFMDGKTIEVFYQKEGNVCKVYSKADVTKYNPDDVSRIKSTNIERTDHVEGKCYATKSASSLISLAKSLIKRL